jgi:hypothetical protein
VPTLGRRFLLPLDPVRPNRFAPNQCLPASNRSPPAKSVSSRVKSASAAPNLPASPTNQASPYQITANPPKLSPNPHKNPRRQERRRRPQRDGRKVQEDNCTGASAGIPMADGSTRPATSSSARPSGNDSVHPAVGHPFHVCKWLMVTTTTTTVHGGLLPTVLASWVAQPSDFSAQGSWWTPPAGIGSSAQPTPPAGNLEAYNLQAWYVLLPPSCSVKILSTNLMVAY